MESERIISPERDIDVDSLYESFLVASGLASGLGEVTRVGDTVTFDLDIAEIARLSREPLPATSVKHIRYICEYSENGKPAAPRIEVTMASEDPQVDKVFSLSKVYRQYEDYAVETGVSWELADSEAEFSDEAIEEMLIRHENGTPDPRLNALKRMDCGLTVDDDSTMSPGEVRLLHEELQKLDDWHNA